MRTTIAITILSGLMFLAACSDPAAEKSKAVTGEAAQVASPQSTQGVKYQITPQNSKIDFVGSKVTGSENGSFGNFSGQIDYAGAAESSRVSVTIEMDSVRTESSGLETHLKTADFFDVAKFPQSTFVSTAIRAGGDKGASHTITGNLTLHGVTRSISFPATIAVTPDTATVDSSFSLNRKDFGIMYAGKTNDLIRDGVVLTFHIRANKAS